MTTETKRRVRLVPITRMDQESILKIRQIRNEDGVRKWMYTDHEIGVDEHLAWAERLRTDYKQIAFAVVDDLSSPLGLVSVNAIDNRHARADWAYYLTADARSGLGAALEYSFLNFVFDDLELAKLNCEVIEGNDAVVKLHKKFLFQEEGFRRSNIAKGERRLGVHFLGLTKDDWLAQRCFVYQRYSAILDKFALDIEWESVSNFDAAEALGEIESSHSFWGKYEREVQEFK